MSTTPDEDDIPADILKQKLKLEKETGKKYLYRPRNRPGIGDMLAYGAPEDEGIPRTWAQMIMYPLILAVIFMLSFVVFVNTPHSMSKGRSHVLPTAPKFGKNKLSSVPPGTQRVQEALKVDTYPNIVAANGAIEEEDTRTAPEPISPDEL